MFKFSIQENSKRPERTFDDPDVATPQDFVNISTRAREQTGGIVERVHFDITSHGSVDMLDFLTPLFSEKSLQSFAQRFVISKEEIKIGFIHISKANALLVNSRLFNRLCALYSYNRRFTGENTSKKHCVVEFVKAMVFQMEHNLVTSHNCAFESLLTNGEVDFTSPQLASLVIIVNSGEVYVDPQQVLFCFEYSLEKFSCNTLVYLLYLIMPFKLIT